MQDEMAKFPTKAELRTQVAEVRTYVDEEYARVKKESASLYCTVDDF